MREPTYSDDLNGPFDAKPLSLLTEQQLLCAADPGGDWDFTDDCGLGEDLAFSIYLSIAQRLLVERVCDGY